MGEERLLNKSSEEHEDRNISKQYVLMLEKSYSEAKETLDIVQKEYEKLHNFFSECIKTLNNIKELNAKGQKGMINYQIDNLFKWINEGANK